MSVFRELFVEVPLALLEAAVIRAQQPKETRAVRLGAMHPDVWVYVFRSVVGADWSFVGWIRDGNRDRVQVRVRMSCGHKAQFFIDDMPIVRAHNTAEIVNHLLDVIDKGPARSCPCGVPQGLGPAGKATP